MREIESGHMRLLGDALGSGAAPALKALYLGRNKIGDEGLRHLSDALALGAAPALETLSFGNNPASAAAKQAAKDALKQRASRS